MSGDNSVLVQQLFTSLTEGEGMTGVITPARLANFLSSMNIRVTEELLADIIEYGTDGTSRNMDYKQFKRLYDAMSLEEGEDPTREHYVPDASGSDANARAAKLAFQALDRDQDRKIGVDDLRNAFIDQEYAGAGEAATVEDAASLTDNDLLCYIYAVDPEKQTFISRAGFHTLMSQAEQLRKTGNINTSTSTSTSQAGTTADDDE